MLHLDPNGNEQLLYANPEPTNPVQEVVVIDGVFMCTTKKGLGINSHDEKLITGFHLYDLNFSFSISGKYKVLVTFDIKLTHLTTNGSYGSSTGEVTF